MYMYIYIYIYTLHLMVYKTHLFIKKISQKITLHLNIYIYIILYINIVKSATLVKGEPKAPFSIATTPRSTRRAQLHSLGHWLNE